VAATQALRVVGRGLVTLVLAGLALPQQLEAQVGLVSNIGQVTLVARATPRASIQGVGPARETARQGSTRGASVTVRLSTNTGYRLMVLGTPELGAEGSRVWVRAADGNFEELTPRSSVTVARGARSAGQWEREVSYRIESATEAAEVELPVRYEIVVNPTI
jgi:hypothetical protein